MSTTVNLEIKSTNPAQVQILNSSGQAYNWTSTAWATPATLVDNGLTAMTASTNPTQIGWYSYPLVLNASFVDGTYTAMFYGVDPTSGPELVSVQYFSMINGMPFISGLPPTPTDIAVRVLEATVAKHNDTGTVGALYNELQALITRLNAYLTKQGA